VLTLSARGTCLRAVSICTKRAVRAVRQVTCPVSQATGLRGHPNLGTGRQAACLVSTIIIIIIMVPALRNREVQSSSKFPGCSTTCLCSVGCRLTVPTTIPLARQHLLLQADKMRIACGKT